MTPDPAGPAGPAGPPLRIAYVLGTTAGGTGPHVAMLAHGCTARGMTVRVFGPQDSGRRYFPGDPAFMAVEIADRPRPARDLAAVLRLRRLLRDWVPDVVHAHGLRAGGLAALAGTGALVVTVHNAPPAGALNRVSYAALERLAARRADAVTWVAGDLGTRLRRAGARDAGRAVIAAPPAPPPTADQVAAARASLGEAGQPVVLAVGRLAEQKGFAVLIDAASCWQDRDPVPLLAIAGEGPLAGDLAARARAAGSAVRFLGRRADVPALMAAADVVVVPSAWDGQPLVVQEALRAGRPLVASRAGGIPDMTGEDAALLVPVGDVAALAKAVMSVLDDPGTATTLRASAVARAAALPGPSEAVDAVVALYHTIVRPAR